MLKKKLCMITCIHISHVILYYNFDLVVEQLFVYLLILLSIYFLLIAKMHFLNLI